MPIGEFAQQLLIDATHLRRLRAQLFDLVLQLKQAAPQDSDLLSGSASTLLQLSTVVVGPDAQGVDTLANGVHVLLQ